MLFFLSYTASSQLHYFSTILFLLQEQRLPATLVVTFLIQYLSCLVLFITNCISDAPSKLQSLYKTEVRVWIFFYQVTIFVHVCLRHKYISHLQEVFPTTIQMNMDSKFEVKLQEQRVFSLKFWIDSPRFKSFLKSWVFFIISNVTRILISLTSHVYDWVLSLTSSTHGWFLFLSLSYTIHFCFIWRCWLAGNYAMGK